MTSFFQMVQKSIRGPVFISGLFFIGLIHITLSFHSILTDTVNDDMRMDVSRLVATVCVSDNQCLITWKIFLGKFQTKFLRPFPGKSAFCCVCRIKADDIMMAFNIFLLLVFIEEEAIEVLVDKAFEENLGARALKNVLSEILFPIKYDAGERKAARCIIRKETILEGAPPYWEEDRNEKGVKKVSA